MKLNLFFSFLILLSLNISAQENIFSGIKVDKADLRNQLEIMKKSGQISNTDYLKTLNELEKMDDNKIQEIKNKAIDTIQKNPAGAQKLIDQKLD